MTEKEKRKRERLIEGLKQRWRKRKKRESERSIENEKEWMRFQGEVTDDQTKESQANDNCIQRNLFSGPSLLEERN
jgi:hypothetical protein